MSRGDNTLGGRLEWTDNNTWPGRYYDWVKLIILDHADIRNV